MPVTSQTATAVFGQAGSFITRNCNNGSLNASSLCGPIGLALDITGRLRVADSSNARALAYDAPVDPSASVGGIAEPPDVNRLPARNSTGSRAHRIAYELAGLVSVLAVVATGAWATWRRRRVSR